MRARAYCAHPSMRDSLALSTNSEKFEDSCSLDEDDLIEFMTVCDNKEVDNDEVEGEAELFRYSTTFGTVILQERING
ncbi:hypothetical protein TNCV_2009741 [Trichonephila clavipes]|nr:hypothetical protein TNCV_2009741 [Trichonephila clavipes]